MLWFLNLPAKLTLLFDIYKQLECLLPANVYILYYQKVHSGPAVYFVPNILYYFTEHSI